MSAGVPPALIAARLICANGSSPNVAARTPPIGARPRGVADQSIRSNKLANGSSGRPAIHTTGFGVPTSPGYLTRPLAITSVATSPASSVRTTT